MESIYQIKIAYNVPTDLPQVRWRQEKYPVYEEILDKVRELSRWTGTRLDFFEKYANATVEEYTAVYNFSPQVYGLQFPENRISDRRSFRR